MFKKLTDKVIDFCCSSEALYVIITIGGGAALWIARPV